MVISHLRLPFNFDPLRLKADVNLFNHDLWKLHYQTLYYKGNWSGIPLRSINGNPDSILISPLAEQEYKDTPFLSECGYIKEVIEHFKCPLNAVRLLKLNAGAIIKEHRDTDLNYEKGEIRIHIPITTHRDVFFYLADDRIVLEEGSCWYLNFNLPHRVDNFSPVDRIHLVIDAMVNDWVVDLFKDPRIIIKKETDDDGTVIIPKTSTIDIADKDDTKRMIISELRKMGTVVSAQMADDMEVELNNG